MFELWHPLTNLIINLLGPDTLNHIFDIPLLHVYDFQQISCFGIFLHAPQIRGSLKHWMLIFKCCRSYETPSGEDKDLRVIWSLVCLYLYFHTDFYLYEILFIAAIKPLFAPPIRDKKHTWNSHINMSFCYSFREKKYSARNFV